MVISKLLLSNSMNKALLATLKSINQCFDTSGLARCFPGSLQLATSCIRECDFKLMAAKYYNVCRTEKTREIYFLIRKSTNSIRFS